MVFRRAHLVVTFNSVVLTNVLRATVSLDITNRVSEAQVVLASKPASGDHYDAITIAGGCTGTYLNQQRFGGYLEDFDDELFPGACTLICKGPLGRALEFQNSADRGGIGGLDLLDLVGATYGADEQIVQAVLTTAGVIYNPSDIGGTGRLMGSSNREHWVWRAGTQTDVDRPQYFRDQGQTAMDYIEQVDRVSAFFDVPSGSGGFYTLYDGMSGTPYRKLIGGRPRSTADLTFTEGVNILRGTRYRRRKPIANAVLVKGYDHGGGGGLSFGPVEDFIQESNPFMVYPPKVVMDTYTSPLIEWSTEAQAAAYGTNIGAPGAVGMSCEIVKQARILDVNREIVEGSLTTFIDDPIWPGQTHLVQGPGGTQGRLVVAEKLWCRANTIDWSPVGNVLVFTQTPSHIGGGSPDTGLALPPS